MSIRSLVLALVVVLSSACSQSSNVDRTIAPLVLTPDGAWCWFQDPRAIQGSGPKQRLYAGWVTRQGLLQVGGFDPASRTTELATLKSGWPPNDHNSNSFLGLPDGRIMVFYSQHNGKGLYSRVTERPEDISRWSEEVQVTASAVVTYSHPFYLSDERRFYVFWRGENWKPTFATSTDGIHWGAPRVLMQDRDRASSEIRPYLKVVSDGKAEIHFAFTDDHPAADARNSIYYLKYREGSFYKADGAVVGKMEDLPVQHRQSDIVYSAKDVGDRSWIWDVALTPQGAPVIAYARFPSPRDHRYHYARWTGSAWTDQEIVRGGRWFPRTPWLSTEREVYYSGGMAIDKSDASTVYLSRQIDGVFEIERWATANGGRSWTTAPITAASEVDNVRPVVLHRSDGGTAVLWMRGTYVHYTDFATGIVILDSDSSSRPSTKAPVKPPS